MKVDLPDIISVKSGSTNVNKILQGHKELWPNYQKSIIIHGYITPNTSNVKAIDLGIHPTKDTKLELYIHHKNSNQGNGSTNLGLGTTADGAGGTYPDNNDWRFFWTS